MSDLTGDTAVVTGASAGIGRATARQLARNGADVALVARRESRLEELATALEGNHGVEALVVPTDVGDEKQVTSMVGRVVDEFGGLDVVVNNAAIGSFSKPVDEITGEEFRRLMAVNVDGMFYVAREALPHLRTSGGNLIFVGSFAGQYPRPKAPVYAASKWWTRGFAHSLAGAVGEEDVAVSIVNPTEVRTEIGSGDTKPAKERHDPGEASEPEAIAEAIAFAARQDRPDTVHELDLYRRDKLGHF